MSSSRTRAKVNGGHLILEFELRKRFAFQTFFSSCFSRILQHIQLHFRNQSMIERIPINCALIDKPNLQLDQITKLRARSFNA